MVKHPKHPKHLKAGRDFSLVAYHMYLSAVWYLNFTPHLTQP
jgi:hypothetical protein